MMQFVNTKSLSFYKSKFEQIIPYIFLLILLCSCLRMFPEIWIQKNNSPLGNPLLLGDYPVWSVYAQKISAIKLSDFGHLESQCGHFLQEWKSATATRHH